MCFEPLSAFLVGLGVSGCTPSHIRVKHLSSTAWKNRVSSFQSSIRGCYRHESDSQARNEQRRRFHDHLSPKSRDGTFHPEMQLFHSTGRSSRGDEWASRQMVPPSANLFSPICGRSSSLHELGACYRHVSHRSNLRQGNWKWLARGRRYLSSARRPTKGTTRKVASTHLYRENRSRNRYVSRTQWLRRSDLGHLQTPPVHRSLVRSRLSSGH